MFLKNLNQSILLNIPSQNETINISSIKKLSTHTQSHTINLLHKLTNKSLSNGTCLRVPFNNLTISSSRVNPLLSLIYSQLTYPLWMSMIKSQNRLMRLNIPLDYFSVSLSRKNSLHISCNNQILNWRSCPSKKLSQNLPILSRPNNDPLISCSRDQLETILENLKTKNIISMSLRKLNINSFLFQIQFLDYTVFFQGDINNPRFIWICSTMYLSSGFMENLSLTFETPLCNFSWIICDQDTILRLRNMQRTQFCLVSSYYHYKQLFKFLL